MRILHVLTQPAIEPVTVAEAKLYARQDNDQDDDLFTSLIKSARSYCENYCNRSFINTVYTLQLDGFPLSGGYFLRVNRQNPTSNNYLPTNAGAIPLPRPPLVSVGSISYTDTSGATQTLSTTVYEVKKGSDGVGQVINKYGQVYPSTLPQPGSVTITYTAGYGTTAATVPDAIKTAIKILVNGFYDNRQPVMGPPDEVPISVAALLSPYVWETYS